MKYACVCVIKYHSYVGTSTNFQSLLYIYFIFIFILLTSFPVSSAYFTVDEQYMKKGHISGQCQNVESYPDKQTPKSRLRVYIIN